MTTDDPRMVGLLADVEVFGRMGATGFQVGHLDDTPMAEDARWWASVQWRGMREMEEDHRHAADATRALARRLLEGGQCVHCGRTVTTYAVDPGAGDPQEESATCLWTVEGEHWLRGCDGGYGPPPQGLSRAQRRRQERVERLRRRR